MSNGAKAIFFALASLFVYMQAPYSYGQTNDLAIFNFRAANIEAMGYNGEILYALISKLESEKSIELMSRRTMEEKLAQGGMAQGDNTQLVLKAGKLLGISYILFGTVTKQNGRIHAELKLMNIQHRRVIKIWTPVFSGQDDILNQTATIAADLAKSIGPEEGHTETAAKEASSAPYTIENLRVAGKGKTVIVTWKFDPAAPVTAFQVYRSEREKGPFQFIGKSDTNRFADLKIEKGRTYYYRIGMVLSNGDEVRSGGMIKIANAGEKLPYPPLVMGGKGLTQRTEIQFVPALLNLEEKFVITKYTIYRRHSEDSDWKPIETMAAKRSGSTKLTFIFTDKKDITDGKTFTYAVSSIDQHQRESPLSDSITLKTVVLPRLTVVSDNLPRKIIVSWKPLENVDGYNLYRRENGGQWKKTTRISGARKSEFTDQKRLKDQKYYQYYLTAYDGRWETGPSNTVKAKTKDLPPAPTGISIERLGDKKFRVSWHPVDDSDISGYSVYRGTDAKKLKRIAKIKGYQSGSYTDSGKMLAKLKAGATYYWAVKSFNRFQAEGEISETVSLTIDQP